MKEKINLMMIIKKFKFIILQIISIILLLQYSFTVNAASETEKIFDDCPLLTNNDGAITISFNNLRTTLVSIKKHTQEGEIEYYKEILIPEDGFSSYTFKLDCCEYNKSKNEYVSSYEITISDYLDQSSVFKQDNLIIEDTDKDEYPQYDYTQCNYNITFKESDEINNIITNKTDKTTDNIKYYTTDVKLDYIPYMAGDVNLNNSVDVDDASNILEYYAKQAAHLECNILQGVADVDRNGEISVDDASCVLSYYANQAIGYQGTIYEFLYKNN